MVDFIDEGFWDDYDLPSPVAPIPTQLAEYGQVLESFYPTAKPFIGLGGPVACSILGSHIVELTYGLNSLLLRQQLRLR